MHLRLERQRADCTADSTALLSLVLFHFCLQLLLPPFQDLDLCLARCVATFCQCIIVHLGVHELSVWYAPKQGRQAGRREQEIARKQGALI